MYDILFKMIRELSIEPDLIFYPALIRLLGDYEEFQSKVLQSHFWALCLQAMIIAIMAAARLIVPIITEIKAGFFILITPFPMFY